jgi:hypothetical protein
MAAPTVKDVLGDIPAMDFDLDSMETPDPSKIWANYDEEFDTFIIYTTGKPRRGVHVWVGDDLYVIVDSPTRKVIGLYVEHWQRNFVPAHAEVQLIWEKLRPVPMVGAAWIALLRMIARWIMLSFETEGKNYSPGLQPA